MNVSAFDKLREQNARAFGWRGVDYDYSLLQGLDARGHGTDKGKLPNHPTFSNESAFATPQFPGGRWGRDFTGDTFTPSQRMLQGQGSRYSPEYMQRYERDVGIRLPK